LRTVGTGRGKTEAQLKAGAKQGDGNACSLARGEKKMNIWIKEVSIKGTARGKGKLNRRRGENEKKKDMLGRPAHAKGKS